MAQRKLLRISFLIGLFLAFLLILFVASISGIFHGITGIFPLENFAGVRYFYYLLFRVLDYNVVSIILIIPLILLCMLLGLALFQYQKFVINFKNRVNNKIENLQDETTNTLMNKMRTDVFKNPKTKERKKYFKKLIIDVNKKSDSSD